jgi:Tfp pilus assembly protein PilX
MSQVTQFKSRQSGAVLVIALMFLIAITLITVSSMRSSKIGLYMAQNEESRIVAEQAAQALADAIVANPGSTPVIGATGFTACTFGEADCNRNDLPVDNSVLAGAVSESHISARVERTGLAFRPPPRIVESSIDKFSAASFKVTTTYDRTADGLGRQQVNEGVLVLVPKQ